MNSKQAIKEMNARYSKFNVYTFYFDAEANKYDWAIIKTYKKFMNAYKYVKAHDIANTLDITCVDFQGVEIPMADALREMGYNGVVLH